jgi:hypothetical protein
MDIGKSECAEFRASMPHDLQFSLFEFPSTTLIRDKNIVLLCEFASLALKLLIHLRVAFATFALKI